MLKLAHIDTSALSQGEPTAIRELQLQLRLGFGAHSIRHIERIAQL